MSGISLEQRVATLERQMAVVVGLAGNGLRKKDWRRTVGMFTDDPEMQELFSEALQIREADRKKARAGQSKWRGGQS
jgi:hypothetical protein